jgi:hypothetical protein
LFTTEQKYFLGGTKTYAPCTIGAEFRWEIGLWARIRAVARSQRTIRYATRAPRG